MLNFLICLISLIISIYVKAGWPIISVNIICLLYTMYTLIKTYLKDVETQMELEDASEFYRKEKIKELNPYKWGN